MKIDKLIIKEFNIPYQYQHIIKMSVNEGYNEALAEVERMIDNLYIDDVNVINYRTEIKFKLQKLKSEAGK